jgi:hypothetical protein
MASHNEIGAFLDDFLEIGSFSDYGPNGLLLPGAEEVTKVVAGVSAQRELFEHAVQERAQLVLCDHGSESADLVSSCQNGSAWSTGSWTFPIRSSQKTYAKSKKRLRCPRQALP